MRNLTAAEIATIRERYTSSPVTQAELADDFGVTKDTVNRHVTDLRGIYDLDADAVREAVTVADDATVLKTSGNRRVLHLPDADAPTDPVCETVRAGIDYTDKQRAVIPWHEVCVNCARRVLGNPDATPASLTVALEVVGR